MGQLYKYFKYHELWIPSLKSYLEENSKKQIHDPCAGSGEVNLMLEQKMSEDLEFQFVLSDFMFDKNRIFAEKLNAKNNERIQYINESIDATKFDESHQYPKVFINSFHHFTPKQVLKIIEAGKASESDILILEYCRKTPLAFISVLLGPFVAMLMFPLVVNRKEFLPAFVLTYLVPIIPLMLLWDGIVSSLRTYTKNDLQKLLKANELTEVKMDQSISHSMLYPSGVSSIKLMFPQKNSQKSTNML